MVIGGHNLGRVGVIVDKEKHPGSFDIVHIKDAAGHSFATRLGNVFIIGKGTTSVISLPSAKGVRKSIVVRSPLPACTVVLNIFTGGARPKNEGKEVKSLVTINTTKRITASFPHHYTTQTIV